MVENSLVFLLIFVPHTAEYNDGLDLEQMASQFPGPSSNQNRPTYSRNMTVTRYKEENSRSRKNPFQDK